MAVRHLAPEAGKRLEAVKQGDTDELYRFRFTSQQRLWGTRVNDVFRAHWWDSEHKVCPTKTHYPSISN